MKNITFQNNYFELPIPEGGFKEGQKVLFMGFLRGVTGGYNENEEGNFVFNPNDNNTNTNVFANNFGFFLDIVKKGAKLFVLSTAPTNRHFWSVMNNDIFKFVKSNFQSRTKYLSYIKRHMCTDRITGKEEDIPRLNKLAKKGMKFDYIIQNPPYDGSLHLDFFKAGLDLLSENGKMVIIEPATWLINVRKNGKAKIYDAIKARIEGHVESVKIENLNKDFNTNLFMPFSVTTIDMSKNFDTIKFTVCGEEKEVKSIYDCNLVGDYATIWSILEKVTKFGVMKSHITKEDKGEGMCYVKYQEIIGGYSIGCNATTERVGMSYDGEGALWGKSLNGEYPKGYFISAYHHFNNEISDTPHCAYDRGKHLTTKITDNVYGTRQELENWKHFIFNNKLPLFLNIVLTIDQNNNSKDFLPWLVDKQYTDEEINQMFGFTDEEVALIDRTIKKYERNSPWFKRYMCGPASVSDEEVNNYLKAI